MSLNIPIVLIALRLAKFPLPLSRGLFGALVAHLHTAERHLVDPIDQLAHVFLICQRHAIEPFAWFRDVLSRIATHPVNRLVELLPSHITGSPSTRLLCKVDITAPWSGPEMPVDLRDLGYNQCVSRSSPHV